MLRGSRQSSTQLSHESDDSNQAAHKPHPQNRFVFFQPSPELASRSFKNSRGYQLSVAHSGLQKRHLPNASAVISLERYQIL